MTYTSVWNMLNRCNGLKISLLALLLVMVTTTSWAQQWATSHAPYSRHINGSMVLGNGRMVVAGGNASNDAIQSVFTSASSGLSWNINRDILAPWLWSVDFADDQLGIAVGNDGTVIRTFNGGITWEAMATGTDRHLRGVQFIDTTTIIAVGGQPGTTPMQTILRSTDGGIEWETLFDGTGAMLNTISVIDADHLVAAGANGTVLTSNDGGDNWATAVTPSLRAINALHFHDSENGLAVGGQFTNDSIRTIWTTTDGGASWSVVLDEPGGWLRDIDFVDGSTGYAVGDVSTVLKTTDGGGQWLAVSVPLLDYDVSYNTVQATSGDLVLVAGSYGTIRILHEVPAPTVATNEALVIAPTTATLKGTLNSAHGGTYQFLFSAQPDMVGAGETPQTTFAGSGSAQAMSFNIPNLTEGATYYYAAKASTLGGIAIGDTMSVTMVLPLPYAETQGALVTPNYAQLMALVNSYGQPGEYAFLTADNPELTGATEHEPTPFNSTHVMAVFYNIMNVNVGSTIYYTIKVTSDAGTSFGDTLWFTVPSYNTLTMTVDSAVNAFGGSPDLFGTVDSSFADGNFYFEYGPSNSSMILNVIPATVHSITGTGAEVMTATVTETLPMGSYQYRLKAVTDNGTYLSYSRTFLVGIAYTDLSMQSVSYDILTETATVTGHVAGLTVAASMKFMYSDGITSGETPGDPAQINDDQSYTVTGTFQVPADNTAYWVTIVAVTADGMIQGTSMYLTAGVDPSFLSTLTAKEITGPTAQLRGHVGDLGHATDIFFEYGLTPALGSEIASTIGTVPPNSPQTVDAGVEDLLPDTYYYYCMRAEVDGNIFYADTRQFYTGEPPIPNWDFSEWENRTVEIPVGWNIMESTFERIDLGNNNSALRLQSFNAAMLGYYLTGDDEGGLPNFEGNTAFNHRPENIHLVMEHNVEPGEIAYMILKLDSADVTLHFDGHPITGTTGGAFQEMAIPITYDGEGTPDRVFIGFITFDFMVEEENSGEGNNHLTIDRIHFGEDAPIVDHTDLNDWITYSYPEVQGWSYTKFLEIIDADSPQMGVPITYGPQNDTAFGLFNLTSDYFDEGVWVETSDNSMAEHLRYFEVDRRYEVLTGYYSFSPEGNDSLEISIQLMAGNDFIGHGQLKVWESAAEMTPFEIPIQYYASGIPELAVITIHIVKSPGVLLTSSAAIDKLCFDGFYIGPQIEDSIPDGIAGHRKPEFRIYPNPTSDVIRVEREWPWDTPCVLTVKDMSGRTVREVGLEKGGPSTEVSLAGSRPGIYLITLNTSESIVSKRLILVR